MALDNIQQQAAAAIVPIRESFIDLSPGYVGFVQENRASRRIYSAALVL